MLAFSFGLTVCEGSIFSIAIVFGWKILLFSDNIPPNMVWGGNFWLRCKVVMPLDYMARIKILKFGCLWPCPRECNHMKQCRKNITIHTFFWAAAYAYIWLIKHSVSCIGIICLWNGQTIPLLQLGVLQSHSFSCPSHIKAYCRDTVTSMYQLDKNHIKLL